MHGAVTSARKGETLAPLGELADAGVVGFSDDGAPVRSASLLANALAYAGSLGLPVVDHPEDPSLTEGAEAAEGYVATVLGLRGWPGSAESGSVARSIAILADVVRDVPGARLHLTHVSTAASLAQVRAAKAAGLPVTCDVTPHHLGLTDQWIAGSRRWSWDAVDGDGRALDPWADGSITAAPFDTSLRVNPPLRPGRGRDRVPGGAAGRHRGRHRHRPRPAHRGRQARRVRLGGQRDQRHRDRDRHRAGRGGRRRPAARPRDRGADDRAGRGPRASRGPGVECRSGTASPRTSSSSTAGRRGASSPGRSGRRARTRRCSGASSRAWCG